MTIINGRRVLAGFAVTVIAAATAAGAAAEPVHLRILHINDMDRMDADDGRGGMAKVVAAFAAMADGPDLVLRTHGGDFLSPSLLSGFDQGAHMVDLINQAGFDIVVPGNHEFDFGPERAVEVFQSLAMPVVSSNILTADGAQIEGTMPTFSVDVGDYTIGFLGLTATSTTVRSSTGDLVIADPLEAAAATAETLREDGADMVIAIAHTDRAEDAALLQQGAVDLLLGGDDHILASYYDGRSAYVESREQGDFVTAVDLMLDQVEGRSGPRFVWAPSFQTIDTVDVEPDPEMAAAVQVYLDQLSAELDVEIGTTETELDSRRAVVRGQETALGNLITDAMREATGADAALTNGGGIRADRIYDPGTVLSRRDIISELPFGNKTVVLEVSGADLLAALENGFSDVEGQSGRFPHLSGMTAEVDLAAEPGSRVIAVTVAGQPLDTEATYSLATNDFLARGGDGYASFIDRPTIIDAMAGQLMASQVIDHVADRGTVAPAVEGRIVFR